MFQLRIYDLDSYIACTAGTMLDLRFDSIYKIQNRFYNQSAIAVVRSKVNKEMSVIPTISSLLHRVITDEETG